MRLFRRLSLSTLIAVYILILVGGIVRSTGSGMGCPDWPKCFGSWVPPSSVSELPADYKEIYASHRQEKNQRFVEYLYAMGMDGTATAILNDPDILKEADFNATKTWIEYFNRLVGVAIGILVFAVFLSSLRLWGTEPRITLVSFITFILVGFQGWIGSVVVSTNLTPWVISVHMFLALLIVALLIYLVHQSSFGQEISTSLGFWWLVASMAVLLVQILLGTQVREAIDQIAENASREAWISNLQGEFIIHRSFSWLVLIMNTGLVVKLRKTQDAKAFTLTLIVLILGTILTGMGMAYFGVPPFLQPVHLLLATASFGMQFMLLLKINRKKEPAFS